MARGYGGTLVKIVQRVTKRNLALVLALVHQVQRVDCEQIAVEIGL